QRSTATQFRAEYGYLMFDNKCFEKVVKIATARVPIMTFNHVETGLLCDVTFLNKLGLKNSEMLRFLLSLDPRIRDLALIVKYWAKVHELASLGNYSNYAITFMVIYYLQQLPEPLVPPIYHLQKLAGKKEVCENWDCSFCSDVNKLPKVTNTSTTKELLLGFFDYWACFDFERNLACTLLGRTFQKSEFQDYENLPDELEGYKRHAREVHAQLEADKLLETAVDKEQKLTFNEKRSKLSFFEKIHALNYDLPEPLLKRFQWLCEYARDEVLSKQEDGKALLDLFLPPKNKPPEIVTHEFTNQKDLFMDNYTILGVNLKEERYKEVWFILARLTLVFVLTHIYCLEFEMDDSNETKAIMSSERMELIDNVYRTVCMKMKGASTVFHNRVHSRKRLLMTNDAFINECVVTREIIMFLRNKEREKGDFSEKLLGNFTMKIRFFCFPEEPRPRLMVQFINCKSPHFNTVSNSLNAVLLSGFQRNIERCIKENNLPVKEYLRDGGGDWYDFANYFEDFVRNCTEKGRGLCEDPRYAIVLQKTETIQNDKKEEEST
ncbi:uncharacterized protein LOC120356574, partial [Nilaparvata lugens]|uniref:uncharacterized protein LOC120356574 n=1 Tax=Nilaparvata lugens TaxID=108931 RepID=UPI00193EBE0E